MALHNLRIVVVDGGKSGSYKSKKSSTGENSGANDTTSKIKNSALYKAMHPQQTISNQASNSGMSATQVVALNMGMQLATSTIKQTANYYISDIGRKNGDSNYQQLINRNFEVLSDIGSVVTGALSGAVAGSTAGPIGAVIGAVVGTAASGISLGFKYAEREREYQQTMFENETTQAYNLTRAGYVIYTGRRS